MKKRKISGTECEKILCKHFGFYFVRQKGSHRILKKDMPSRTIGTVVPKHKELGTLKNILHLAKVDYEEFKKFY